ncbi:MAG: CRISPR-associated endonuclease Cas2 [Elusimicrobia bacterium CG08_land_8_20_14_0_20_51_18]|nr:MAG: CRISPR-associated endonuclease Cas2 [Elusimicrobia bacterium CG08_land_8_20_14_0_20_51_18]
MGKNIEKFFLILDTYYGVKYGYNLERKINLLEEFPKKWKDLDRKHLAMRIVQLKRSKYISPDKKDKRSYRLTPKGLFRLIRAKARSGAYSRDPAGPEGEVKIVFFDIPENRKKDRNRFRFFLKELGFKELQKSIFTSRYDCEKELSAISDFLKLRDFVITGDFRPAGLQEIKK